MTKRKPKQTKYFYANMRKHRNPAQERIFVEFMESHKDIARGYVKGDRVAAEALWTELAEKLNASGPPSKDCNGWKITWANWKVYVKKKLCHNRKKKTGGGQYKKYVLTDVEKSLARVSGIHRSVDGVDGAGNFGEMELYLCESDKENVEVELTTSKHAKKYDQNDSGSSGESIRNSTPAFKRRRSCTQSPDSTRYKACAPSTHRTPLKSDVNSLLVEENKHLKSIGKQMEEHCEVVKVRNKKLDKLCNILENHYNASHLHNIEMQKKMHEKNQLKLKIIEIKSLRLELEREKLNKMNEDLIRKRERSLEMKGEQHAMDMALKLLDFDIKILELKKLQAKAALNIKAEEEP